jgi:hypothetical protein
MGAGADTTTGAGAGAEREVVYRGFVYLPDRSLPLEVRVALPGGATRAALSDAEGLAGAEGSEGPEAAAVRRELERMAAALVRAATKTEAAAGAPLPRKITRWRAPGRG